MSSVKNQIIEDSVRDILVNTIKKYAKKNNSDCLNTKVRFFARIIDGEIMCCYDLLIYGKHVCFLEYSDMTGLLVSISTKGLVEDGIRTLYEMINEQNNIDIEKIQIIISATKADPEAMDLTAKLYGSGVFVRVLNVKEFIK